MPAVDDGEDVQVGLVHHGAAMLLVGAPREEERRGADHVTFAFRCADPKCKVRVALTVSTPWEM